MDVTDNWPFDRIQPHDSEAVYDILTAYERQLDRVDVQSDELEAQRFVQSATSNELEKLAAEVGVQRQTDESDEHLRFRTLIAKAVTRSDGTLDDIGAVLRVIFGDDVQQITVTAADDTPVLELTIPSAFIDDIPLTVSELADELRTITAVGDDIEIITDNTFIFGESGEQGIGNGNLI